MSVDPADTLFPCLSTRICSITFYLYGELINCSQLLYSFFSLSAPTPPPPSLSAVPTGLPPSPGSKSMCADYHWMSSHTMRSLIRH